MPDVYLLRDHGRLLQTDFWKGQEVARVEKDEQTKYKWTDTGENEVRTECRCIVIIIWDLFSMTAVSTFTLTSDH